LLHTLPRIMIGLVININVSKGQGSRKGQKGKTIVNKGLTTKPTQGLLTPWRLGLHGWRP
jgi:hypothetical protein